MPSMHSRPIRFTVSKRLKHVRLFKSNQGLTRLFRCIFHSVKNKKPGGQGLRVDERANPDRPDWCLKWSVHLDGLKRPRAKRELNEWTSTSCTSPEPWVYPWISTKFYSFCYDAALVAVREAWRERGWRGWHQMDRGSKSWRSFLLYNYVSGGQPAIGLSWCTRSRSVASKTNLRWTTTREWNSRWRTQRKSVAILCPLIFWDVILSVTTKWQTNPNVGLATQNSFKKQN